MNLLRTPMTALVFALVLTANAPAQQQQSLSGQSPQPASAEPSSSDAPAPADNGGPNIYPWLAAGLVARGVPVIDVRSAEEIAETGMLADAVNIVHTDTEALIEFIGEDRDRTVVLYCRSGRRAGLAIDKLREHGYRGLVNAGGYQDLAAAIESP